MSVAPSGEKIPLQFIFMCRHDITGYFRRTDGRPLDISTMNGSTGRGVTHEPLDLQADPHVRPRILPLLELCPRCGLQRAKELMGAGKLSGADPVGSYWAQEAMSGLRSQHSALDSTLMEQALGSDIRRVQERVERRLIVETPPTENNNNHNDTHKDEELEEKS